MENLMISSLPINLLFFICILQCTFGQNEPTVNTALGEFKGKLVTVEDIDENQVLQVKQFLSVPFAKPPIGDLRFRKPVPIDELPNSSLQCYNMPKACYQNNESPFPWALSPNIEDSNIGEDCLYMNIWIPYDASPQNKKSIFFWIHGGGFIMGSASLDIYRGQVLAALGDVVVVTTNYRLGVQGFWTNMITNMTDAPGNLGIWDIIEALKWVNTHIEAFGGDKDSVTIAGQDAGAVIVSLLAVTPHARGLFKRQIVQSGSAMWTRMNNPNEALLMSHRVSQSINCANGTYTFSDHPDEIASCTRGYNGCLLTILKASFQTAIHFLHQEALYNTIYTRWTDELFPRNPRQLLLEGGFPFTELLIGNTGNEGAALITTGLPQNFGFFGEKILTPTDFKIYHARQYIQQIFSIYKGISGARFPGSETTNNYFPYGNEDEEVDKRLLLADAVGGFLIACPTAYYAAVSSKSGAKVYYYDFKYKTPNSTWANWMLPTHFDEVKYVFGQPIGAPQEDYLPEERRLSRMMIKHWSNFVKYGKPDNNWPIYANMSERVVYINDRPPITTCGPHGYNCNFWWNYIYPNKNYVLPDYQGLPEYIRA